MKFSSIQDKIKDQLNAGADKFLSSKVKEELGLNKPTIDSLYTLSENQNLDDNLNNFYQPVGGGSLSQKQNKKIQNWALILIAIVSVLLIFLFVSIIIPHQSFKNGMQDAQVFVKGSDLEAEEKVTELTVDAEDGPSLEVRDISVADKEATDALAKSSPLLKPSENISVNRYKIKSGDTLEKIALRFYGSSDPSEVEKIKVANKIRNVRLLRIGQELLVPM